MNKITVFAFMALAFSFGCDSTTPGNDPNYSTINDTGLGEKTEPADGTAVDTESDTAAAAASSTALTSDTMFVAMATSGGIKEVQLGELAKQKATSAEVKKFGQQMIDDHSGANAELKAMARNKKWYPLQRMQVADKADYNRLSQLSGAEFDKAYMLQMVTDHERTIALFQGAAQSATDADLKAWAEKKIPALRMHLDMAQKNSAKFSSM